MFQAKVVEKIKIHFIYSNFCFENRAVYEVMWKSLVQPDGQATDDNIAHAHSMLGT
jgi:hypothetical protein